jgi:hypothetical protein
MLTNPKPKVAPDGYTVVQRNYVEYNPVAWMNLISSVNNDFGKTGKRWQWIMNNELSQGNAWVVDFYFEDPHDATMFSLKY